MSVQPKFSGFSLQSFTPRSLKKLQVIHTIWAMQRNMDFLLKDKEYFLAYPQPS